MPPKLNRQQRDELKSIVVDARIRRLTAKETCDLVFDRLQVTISIDHIRRLSRAAAHIF